MSSEVSTDSEELTLSQKRLFSFLWRKKKVPIPEESERLIFPKASLVSKLFFWWLVPMMNVGYRRTLQAEDLYRLSEEMRIENYVEKFEIILENEVAKSKKRHIRSKCRQRGEKPEKSSKSEDEDLEDLEDFVITQFTLLWSVTLTFKLRIFLSTLLAVLCLSTFCLNPLLAKKLIAFVEDMNSSHSMPVGPGIGYAIGMFLMLLLLNFFLNHFFYNSACAGFGIKTVLMSKLLSKSFVLDGEANHKFPTSKIASMMMTDLPRIEEAAMYLPCLLGLPIPLAIAIVILIVNIGVAALAGIAVFFLFLVGIGIGSKKLYEYRSQVSLITDERVNLITEVLNNLKMIKFYSWEIPYFSKILKTRTREINFILKIQFLRNIINAITFNLTGISSMVSFIVLYAIKSKSASAASIFSSVSVFEILASLLFLLPIGVSTSIDMLMVFKRVGDFLSSHEDMYLNTYAGHLDANSKNAIEITDGNFYWETFETSENEAINIDTKGKNKEKQSSNEKNEQQRIEVKKFSCLKNINLHIKRGDFVVVTGPIGSGKTSLLSAISGFMHSESGKIDILGSLLMCGTPWVQNVTIRNNILFGLPYDKNVYDSIIYSSGLVTDLENLPAGDQTEVGERGITLSGGQKARISLARALYARRDIILLDDVLSAVDSKVGKHIIDTCLLGFLKGKTRILATHQLSLVHMADKIIFMNKDGTIDYGTLDELMSRNHSFNDLMSYNTNSKKVTTNDQNDQNCENEDNEKVSFEGKNLDDKVAIEELGKSIKNTTFDGKITQDEERAVNGISKEIYKSYILFGAGKLTIYGYVPLLALLVALAVFSNLFTNTWLSFWVSDKFNKPKTFYIGLYVMFTILEGIFLCTMYVAIANLSTISSKNLNLEAMKKILHAPMSFLDITPLGRVLNRFTKDTDALDNEIADKLRLFIDSVGMVVGVIILDIIYIPWLAIAIPFLGIIFFAIANYYQASAREIKRLEAVKRSFVYSNFNEVLNGLATIKAYNSEPRFMSINYNLINNMNEASYVVYANQRWISLQLLLLASIFVLILSILCVNNVFHIHSASVGLLVSYSLTLADTFTMTLTSYTLLENDMNSVERLCQYALHLPQEADLKLHSDPVDANWANNGRIEFKNVCLRYREGLPLVLKNLSFNVNGQEKIGICGRTGAGKSSIITALYRISEIDDGKILVDGNDISKLGLFALRSNISIIPQDPVVFSGTIRKNLDPFGGIDDEDLWQALRRTGLIEESQLEDVKGQLLDSDLHKFHLDQVIDYEGKNFSLGERQLIAFARALVRKSKIIVMDEATSSVDFKTDNKIQEVISNEFKDRTVLCIAHRLKTIIKYDKILTLDKGECKEFDVPINLYNNEKSIFRQMCDKSNITVEDFI